MSTSSGKPPERVADAEVLMGTNIGDLVSTFYQHFLDQYGDVELAAVATAAVINDILSRGEPVAS